MADKIRVVEHKGYSDLVGTDKTESLSKKEKLTKHMTTEEIFKLIQEKQKELEDKGK
jgi:hypothetical protein